MRDYLEIGSTPADEDCAQVGQPDYAEKARAECKRFIEQIERHYPSPELGYLKIKSNRHDFGTYYEVVAVYDNEDEASTQWAYAIEGDEKNVLANWDTSETV